MREGTGHVAQFDEHKGYGAIRTADRLQLFFHCTAIASGSRSIEVGTPVTFEVVAGHLGRWEATAVTPAARASAERPR